MADDDLIETVDAEPVRVLDKPLAGIPAELPAQPAAELADLIEDAERVRLWTVGGCRKTLRAPGNRMF